jgi:uncharacterized protein
MERLSLVVFLLGTLVSGAVARPPEVQLKLPSGAALTVEVMLEDADRARGLMFRPSLPEERGMLFVFEDVDRHSIWMKNCRFPLDIVWLDEQRQVVDVAESVPHCRKEPCPVYSPARAALFVLEMNAGQARREGVAVGRTLDFELP